MLFCGITACFCVFLLSCGHNSAPPPEVSNTAAASQKPGNTIYTSISDTGSTTQNAISSDSAISDNDTAMTKPEQKTTSATSKSLNKTTKEHTATAKVAEKNQNIYNTGSTKAENGQQADKNTGKNTGNASKTVTPLPVTDDAAPQQQLPSAGGETKPMHPKDLIPPKPAETLAVFFTAADKFLKSNVLQGSGLVNYPRIRADKTELNALVFKIASANLNQTTDAEKQAFYINAYNILVIKQIADNNLPASPLDVPGFFNQTKFQVAQKTLTLDQLEKNTLFGLKNDPRLHFVLVCAAKGCPPLLNAAYLPKTLNGQLTQQTKAALNSSNFVKINTAAKKASVSKIFEWYNAHFTTGGQTVIQFINQYRNTPIPENYTVDFYEYDWSLNRQ